jgi:hypothetical protein
MFPEPPSLLAEVASELIETRLREGLPVRFRVTTRSMVPTLQPGDEVVVAAQAVGRVSVGSLVVLRRKNAWVVHRLIQRRRAADGAWLMTTKGDCSSFADPLWRGGDWVGVAQAVQRGVQSRDLTTLKIRCLGRWIAALSRLECSICPRARSGLGWLARRVLRRTLIWVAMLVYER